MRNADGATAGTRHVAPGIEAAHAAAPAPPADALAAVRMRLNADAVPDLVVLRPGADAPEVLLSVPTVTFTVTSTADTSGDTCGATCTLRQAIRAANLTADFDAIEFAIPTSDPGFDAATGTYRIRPTSELPEITKPVALDATTQDGFAGRPIVEIDGSLAPAGESGIVVSTVASLVRGFVINGFKATAGNVCGCGIVLNSPFTGFTSDVIVEGNYLGVDVTGTIARPNGQSGVFIANGEGQTIGGTTAAARNVISGHPFAGISITPGEPAHTIAGNYIGTDRTGTFAIPNRTGVLTNSSRSVIGGTVAGARNLISGNTDDGVQISTNGSTAGQNQVIGNYIGTTVDGSFPLPNSTLIAGTAGVRVVDATSTRIGIAGAGNVIAGNASHGVVLQPDEERSAVGNKIQGNRIGVDPLGRPLGNGGYGVLLTNQLNGDVGGRAAGEGNLIAHNALDGIELRSIAVTCPDCETFNESFRNRFFSNLIYENGGIGIDLRNDGVGNPMTNPDGVTANDAPGDTDFGANGLKNFPVLTSATSTAVDSRVMGTRSFGQLQFFMSATCDPSGNGEGQILLGEIPTGGSGTGEPFDVTFPIPIPAGYVVTAIETEASLDGSSEFSTCLAATGGPAPVATATPTPGPTATLVGGIPTAGGPSTTASATPTPVATRTPAPEVCDDCVDNDFDDALDRADGDCPAPANGGGGGLAGDAAKAALTCQKTLAKAGTAFALARVKSLGACVAKVLACVQQKPGDAGCVTKASGACAKAEAARQKAVAKLTASVAKSCGEPALAAADLTGATGLGFAAEASGCDDLGVAPVDDADDVARCVAARHACRAEALVGTAFPRARQLLMLANRDAALEAPCLPSGGAGGSGTDGKGVVKCQKGLAKAGAAYARARLQSRQACAALAFACLQVKPADPQCLPKAKAKCVKLDAKVETALAKIAPALAKACGALSFADVLGASGVGFGLRTGECGALAVDPLDSVTAVAACLGAQHACRVDQLVEGQTPRTVELRSVLP